MDNCWAPGVNHPGSHGCWAYAEFTDVYEMQDDFSTKIEDEFNQMIDAATGVTHEN